jgi:ABC-type branched-subunit amino acid transport system ATPase component
MNQEHYFRIEGLSKSFGGLQAVKNVTFEVKKGNLTSIIGPNGAGKTTLFDLISGFLTSDRGRIVFKGQNLVGRKPHEVVELGMARTFQHLGLFYKMSVWDNVFMALPGKRREHIWGTIFRGNFRQEEEVYHKRTKDILEFLGIADKSGEQVDSLSWGDQKLVSIGRLLATDGEFLLLDEPASGLSDEQIEYLKSLLRDLVSRGKTILLIDHNVEAVMDISEWIIALNFGELIAEGTPADIRANEEVIRVYLGV